MIVSVHVVSIDGLANAFRCCGGFEGAAPVALAPRYRRRAMDSSLAGSTRAEALATGMLLLAVHGVDDDDCLSIGRAGKPYLSDGTASISVSHGGSCCALASAPEGAGELGVDVEPIDGYNRLAASRVFSASEVHWIEAGGDESERAGRFARAWTGLEAKLKAEGTGFERDPRTEGVPDGWHVVHTVWRGHCVAVAAAMPVSIELIEHDPADLVARAFECRLEERGGK